PPRSELVRLTKENGNWHEEQLQQDAPRYAFVGVRPCELAAIQIQDKVFIREDFTDPIYQKRRQNIFILAVDCLHPGDTCFCASMGTGPEAKAGFDVRLTELEDVFLLEVGSDKGLEAIADLSIEGLESGVQVAAAEGLAQAAASMGRQLPDAQAV